MPIITALQMATASFAVPKSVMKTIVARGWAATGAVPFSTCGLEQPAMSAEETRNAEKATNLTIRFNAAPKKLILLLS